jgi:hypothetical protein
MKYIQAASRIGKKFLEDFSEDMKYHTTNQKDVFIEELENT